MNIKHLLGRRCLFGTSCPPQLLPYTLNKAPRKLPPERKAVFMVIFADILKPLRIGCFFGRIVYGLPVAGTETCLDPHFQNIHCIAESLPPFPEGNGWLLRSIRCWRIAFSINTFHVTGGMEVVMYLLSHSVSLLLLPLGCLVMVFRCYLWRISRGAATRSAVPDSPAPKSRSKLAPVSGYW